MEDNLLGKKPSWISLNATTPNKFHNWEVTTERLIRKILLREFKGGYFFTELPASRAE